MGRLTTLKPRVGVTSAARVGPAATSVTRFGDRNRGSRHERGYGWAWEQAVKRIRARDCDICQACVRRNDGHVGTYAAVDHRIPKAEGGTDDDGNLEVICAPCHAEKTAAEARRGRGG
jgi:5-methylcytosine-specific restriction protein A